MRITEAMDLIVARCPRRVADTVDTIKHGDPDQELHGIVCCFTATRAVINEAAHLGANLIITHEPAWWTHHDGLDWLQGDPIRAAKAAALDANCQVVWRLHDHIHGAWPDLIAQGMLRALGWTDQADHAVDFVVRLRRPQTLRELVAFAKRRLGLAMVRHVGDPEMVVSGVGLVPGACGGMPQMRLLQRPDIDAVLCGESAEWETCEYVRDSVPPLKPKAVIVLGRCASQDEGVADLAALVRSSLPGVPVAHLRSGCPFGVM
jgi:putative NIF3 family GTP cyclohydrolase 1 type 2